MRLRLLWSEVLGLETRSRDRHPSTLSVVTHLSGDRLHQLIGLHHALTGDDGQDAVRTSSATAVVSICAAILVHDRAGSVRVRRAVRALPRSDQLILRVQCFTPAASSSSTLRTRLSKENLSKHRWYPINQLRNRALAKAKTDLVLICDVDFRPCHRFSRVGRAAGEAAALLKQVSCRLACVVLPAFEVRDEAGEDDDNCDRDRREHGMDETTPINSSNGCKEEEFVGMGRPDKEWWVETLSSKGSLVRQWEEERVVPFASRLWVQGHRATNFDRWKGARTPYEVGYEEGFEPFVVMNRLLVPPFDERFEGYGRNKVIFFYRLHALGFSFVVSPDLYLVHAPHERSNCWRRTFGREAVVASSSAAGGPRSERFAAILDLYRVAKEEIEAEASQRKDPQQGLSRRGGTARRLLSLNRDRLGCWRAEGPTKLCEYGDANVVRDAMRHALLSSLHALWYEYRPKRIDVVARLESHLPRADTELTIFTQCSLSRLGRLERMCGVWSGVISAALIADRGGRVDRNVRRQAAALHQRVEAAGKCRLDICLCQPAPGPAAGDGLYPMNALRNVALRAAKTDLVLSLDVDTMPMPGLHEIVTSPAVYTQLLELCRGAGPGPMNNEQSTTDTPPAFVVIPALEYVGATSPDDARIQALLQVTNGCRERAVDLVADGVLQAFHTGCFPEGHRQTNLALWAALPSDAPPYDVIYADGYEPYGIFYRRHAPPFDERFRGFGFDKVSHCWHLHRLGWTFRALPAAFLVDLPHPPSEHRKVHRRNPAFRASVDGLFMRFVTEVERSLDVVEPLSSSISSPTPVAAARAGAAFAKSTRRGEVDAENRDRRDYEVLQDLSLIAWGHDWAAAKVRGGGGALEPDGGGGGGWELKGAPSAWKGLRTGSADDDCDEDAVARSGETKQNPIAVPRCVTRGDRERVSVPSRMVGGWAEVSVGHGIHGRSAIRPCANHGVLRYWVHPRWDPKASPRGKLPGLGMSGDVRFFVRWRLGSVGYCQLMMLGRPLTDVCEVHVICQAPFSLEHGITTAIQLEADARRTPVNGGCLTFRAWIDGSVVYEARVYASDAVLSAGEAKGMWVEDALLHVLTASGDGDGDEVVTAATGYVLIGGMEIWARRPPADLVERVRTEGLERPEAFVRKDDGNELAPRDGVRGIPSLAGKVRFVFVASAGRSGTHFLSKLLDTAPGAVAFHEADPTLSGHNTLMAAATLPEKSYGERRHKAEAVLRSARWHLFHRGLETLTYIDTSHLFLKAFSDVVMCDLAPHFRVDVVVLRRDPAAVLKSRIDLGHFCGRHKRSDWLLLSSHDEAADHTAAPRECSQDDGMESRGVERDNGRPVVQGADMDGFEALIAYANHTEAEIRKFKRRYEKATEASRCVGIEDAPTASVRRKWAHLPPDPPPAAEPPSPSLAPLPRNTLSLPAAASCGIVETTLESLQTEQGVRKLFADLGLDVSEERTWPVVEAGRTNSRSGQKRRTVPLEYCRQRIINTCSGQGGVDVNRESGRTAEQLW
ncbi:unnamed protein product [Scytosiphon promiscuus]